MSFQTHCDRWRIFNGWKYQAPLDKIYELAAKYDAMVMVDESHSAGAVGSTGRGVTELYNLKGKIESSRARSAKRLVVLLAVSQQEKRKLLTCSVSVRDPIYFPTHPSNGGSCRHPDVRNDERNQRTSGKITYKHGLLC